MIIDRLDLSERYEVLHPLFAEAFEFLRAPGVAELADGKYELDGDRLVALVVRKPGKPAEEALLESHRRMIDVHYLLSGSEAMLWRSVGDCAKVKTPYERECDCIVYGDEPALWTDVAPGSFAIFFPEDAHAANISAGVLHKVILKVQAKQ